MRPLTLLILLCLHVEAQTPPHEYFIKGNAADAKPAKTSGGLFLAGGGGHVMAGWKWFIECAGGGDIVVLSASGTDFYQGFVMDTIGGADSVETIKFNDGSAARDPRVLEIIAKADGIFLSGGKQTRYLEWWKSTPVADALNAHIRAGKPIGGSSAGLAVLGEHYYASMNGSVTSKTALPDPFYRMVDLGTGFIRAPLLDGVLMDTHFSQRERLGRLLVFLARITNDLKPQRLAGIGVDEGTALCVEPDGTGRVFTEKNGCAWLAQPTQPPKTVEAGKPLVFEHVKVTAIGPESELHLPKLEVTRPVSTRYVSASGGQLHYDPTPP